MISSIYLSNYLPRTEIR